MMLRVTLMAMVSSALIICCVVERVHGAIEEHLVTNLPGQPVVTFKQYAGYINVNEATGKELFYWFVEADHKHAASLPIAFWFNGGPGCSSIGDGFLSELGPFRVTSSESLILNEHSWNKGANIVFVESPVNVGFSYSSTASDYSSFSDSQTAFDAYAFLVNWIKNYPEYNSNEMYIIGESYGGHYVPTLVQEVVNYNKDPNAYHLNLKGFAVGNAWTDAYWDNKGSVQWFHSHALISDQTYTYLIQNCDFSQEFPIDVPNTSTLCNNASATLYNIELSGLDVYNIYGPSCNLPYNNSLRTMMKSVSSAAAINPCADYVTPYLNIPAVKAALHALPSIEWTECSNLVFNKYNTTDILRSMVPVYHELFDAGLRIWVYSGDFDGRVPTTGTREWINTLGLPVEKAWYPWTHPSKDSATGLDDLQVGGYSQVYARNFTFASVRGAGHMVPQDQPGRALTLFKAFLSGEPLVEFSYEFGSDS
ncbi:unnamed protein product [Sphagnum tenellum]